MNVSQVILLLIGFSAWLFLIVLQASSIALPRRSRFELARLRRGGDTSAGQDIERWAVHGRLLAIRALSVSLASLAVTVVSLLGFGWLAGTLLAVSLLPLSLVIAASPPVRRLAGMVYRRYEPRLLGRALRANWLDRFAGLFEPDERPLLSSKPELLHSLAGWHSFLSDDDYRRLMSALMLDDQTVKDVMTPASKIVTARSEDVLGPLVLDELHRTGHSRFPVVDDDLDHVVGILCLQEPLAVSRSKKTVKSVMDSRVCYIHQAKPLSYALYGFLRTGCQLFIVVNDSRRTVGLISLGDIAGRWVGKQYGGRSDQFDDAAVAAANNLPK